MSIPEILPPIHRLLALTALVSAPLCIPSRAVSAPLPAAPSYLTYRYDNARTGWNPSETVLNTGNVSVNSFGKLSSRAVDGQVYAQPLYIGGLDIPNKGPHNVVYAATEHNTVYAFDADSAAAPNNVPLWSVSLGPSVSNNIINCGDIDGPEYGITSTPVIDASSGLMYVVAKSFEGGKQLFRLHALDVRTGAEAPGWPVVIQGTVPGTGGGSVGGQITFNPALQAQRPALLLLNGTVWVAFASHCDIAIDQYHGWVFGYTAANPAANPALYCTSPDAGANFGAAGVWQSGQGPAADADGNLYFLTGNGDVNVDMGGRNVGDSAVKLRPKGDAAGYVTNASQVLLRTDLSAAALPAGPGQWSVLAPGPAQSALIQQHAGDYAKPGYSTLGNDPYTGKAWNTFPYVPGDAGPAGRANQPGGIPDNSNFVLRVQFTVPASYANLPADAHLYLGGFNVDDNNLGTYFNGVLIGSGNGWNTIWRFEVPMAAVKPGTANVVTIVGNEGGGGAGITMSAPALTAEHPAQIQVPAGGIFNGNPDDYFTPSNEQSLDSTDADLGSGGATVLPDQAGTTTPHLLVGVGKDGVVRLLNRDHMGGFTGRTDPNAPDNAVQDYGPIGGTWGSPAYWAGPAGHYVYFGGQGDVVRQLLLGTANGASALSAAHAGNVIYQYPGTTPAISSNASGHGTGVVWTTDRGANALRALDAEDVSHVLYDSNAAPGQRDVIAKVVKFTVPTPIDGKVFVGTSSQLIAYGLLPAGPPPPPANPTATAGNGSVTLNWTASAGAVSYQVQRATVNGGPYTKIASPAAATYTDAPLTNGKTYYYVLTAVSGAGASSAPSVQVSATPTAQAGGVALSAISVAPTSVKSWVRPRGTVTMSAPVKTGSIVVQLTSSNPALAKVPATLMIWAGSATRSFDVATTSVTTPTVITLSASYGGVTKTTTFTITPK